MKKLILIAILAVVVAFGSEALAQGVGVSLDVETISPKRIVPAGNTGTAIKGAVQVFSAKFLCGTIKPSIDAAGNIISPQYGTPLVPGTYLTAINIHNPNFTPVTFYKKAVETLSEDEPRGTVGKLNLIDLGPDQGLEIDCRDITNVLLPNNDGTVFDLTQSFKKGFVVIITKDSTQLDVVGVYTVKNVESRPAVTP